MTSGRKSSIFEVRPLREVQKECVHRVIHFDEPNSSNGQNNMPLWVQGLLKSTLNERVFCMIKTHLLCISSELVLRDKIFQFDN